MKLILLLSMLVALSVARLDSVQPVSYADQIAPIVAMKCNRCHGGPLYEDRQRAGGFDTTSYASLLKGGPRGAGVAASAPDRSSVLMDFRSLPVPNGRHPAWSAAESALV